jgi:hypothetical protein
MSRECGPCTACCSAFELDKKPAGIPCSYLNHKCNIYSRRPTTCRIYQCLWRKGQGPEEARPDRVHLIFDDGCQGTYLRATILHPQAKQVLTPTFIHRLPKIYEVIRVINIDQSVTDNWRDGFTYTFSIETTEVQAEILRRMTLVTDAVRNNSRIEKP